MEEYKIEQAITEVEELIELAVQKLAALDKEITDDILRGCLSYKKPE